ncbi:HAD superfamily hydrolase (TIGR01509 family)/HAD superfamily hydrolase (TIGR01549 family) [Sediminihabitans luteus]|uniref:HAD superfamily hydrolase (TIGR01509 family)/HAD superfamily hydrolase (TIGR01549 family) n=1 Tax=Sediminihabitans luteus TaxID=1138585 RepID=A0A2M9CCV7_9CELL|nr:HAD-IA family hydrolase [Sediminihabitans luteus]PJJ69179.1 HAD superfamily hydrolase (TIGR01509 family)/HAD superfamily hydrolase (TIGR01549 family) [Sediminihabitans luteus]GII98854.1 haloacid dehalogenase [Sediminihabitans luteus]
MTTDLPTLPRPADVLPLGLRTRPDALLLDFGGVVFETTKRPEALRGVAAELADELARAGHDVPADRLHDVLAGGLRALKDWKNAASRRLEPAELDHRTIVREFLCSPLPAPQREVLAGSAGSILQRLTAELSEHVVRPGILELLRTAQELGVRLGIVSNAHSGRAHRALLDAHGLADAFGVQVYSDEVGLRKPHPGIIDLAAQALGTTSARTWYVGDTQDRDVVAGRRAGVSAVVLTRHHRTDTPPYPVDERADAVLDTPAGLVALLRDAVPAVRAVPAVPGKPAASVPAAAPAGSASASPCPTPPSALLLDHGGVLVTSVPEDAARRAFAAHLAHRLTVAGYPVDADAALAAVDAGRARHKAWKLENEAAHAPGCVPEIDATTYWVDLVGPSLVALGPGVPAWLRSEAHALMVEHARSKSTPTLRPGVRALLEHARAQRVPVAIVSNTVCGRAVREEVERFGLGHLVGVHVYSDELGVRKPDPATARAALAALGVDPASAWFVGDKPHRDVLAARGAGVGTVVLVRGGSTPDDVLDALDPALAPDHLVTEVDELLDLWAATTPARSR